MIKKFTKKLATQYHRYLRVLRLLKRPTMTEFKTISKVTAIGLVLIGALGFAISIIVKRIF